MWEFHLQISTAYFCFLIFIFSFLCSSITPFLYSPQDIMIIKTRAWEKYTKKNLLVDVWHYDTLPGFISHIILYRVMQSDWSNSQGHITVHVFVEEFKDITQSLDRIQRSTMMKGRFYYFMFPWRDRIFFFFSFWDVF